MSAAESGQVRSGQVLVGSGVWLGYRTWQTSCPPLLSGANQASNTGIHTARTGLTDRIDCMKLPSVVTVSIAGPKSLVCCVGWGKDWPPVPLAECVTSTQSHTRLTETLHCFQGLPGSTVRLILPYLPCFFHHANGLRQKKVPRQGRGGVCVMVSRLSLPQGNRCRFSGVNEEEKEGKKIKKKIRMLTEGRTTTTSSAAMRRGGARNQRRDTHGRLGNGRALYPLCAGFLLYCLSQQFSARRRVCSCAPAGFENDTRDPYRAVDWIPPIFLSEERADWPAGVHASPGTGLALGHDNRLCARYDHWASFGSVPSIPVAQWRDWDAPKKARCKRGARGTVRCGASRKRPFLSDGG